MAEIAIPSSPLTKQRYPSSGVTAYEIQNLCTSLMTPEDEMANIDLATVVSLLDDEYVRSILAATSETPLSANELSDHCGISTSSVYRRLDRLTDADLVGERTRPRADGHHETVYVSRLDRFELVTRDGEIRWEIDRRSNDVADQLTRLWGKF